MHLPPAREGGAWKGRVENEVAHQLMARTGTELHSSYELAPANSRADIRARSRRPGGCIDVSARPSETMARPRDLLIARSPRLALIIAYSRIIQKIILYLSLPLSLASSSSRVTFFEI